MNKGTRHDLTMVGRSGMSLTGIIAVKTTEANQIIAKLENCYIYVTGQNLAVLALSVAEGTMEIAGVINSVRYTSSNKRGLSFKNILKK